MYSFRLLVETMGESTRTPEIGDSVCIGVPGTP